MRHPLEALSYYEFVAHALGLKAAVVELALYDLSQGVAQWVPSSLLGALANIICPTTAEVR